MKIRKETDILISDIAEMIVKHKQRKARNVPETIRIINAYLRIVMQTLLNGFSFTIPGFGTFDIHKQIQEEAHENLRKSRMELKPVYSGSFRKVGYRYWVMFESGIINTKYMKFVPVENFIKAIQRLVHGSDHDFKAPTKCQ